MAPDESIAAARALFEGSGSMVNDAGELMRIRENRLHPDVGYTALDELCLACISAVYGLPLVPSPAVVKRPFVPTPAGSLDPPSPVSSPPLPLSRLAPATVMTMVTIGFEPSPLQSSPEIPTPLAPGQVPVPMPVLGAGVAFGFARQLRRKIKPTSNR